METTTFAGPARRCNPIASPIFALWPVHGPRRLRVLKVAMRPQPLEYATPAREAISPGPLRRRLLTRRQEWVRWGLTWAAAVAMFGLPVMAVLAPRHSNHDPLFARRAAAYSDMANLDTVLEQY